MGITASDIFEELRFAWELYAAAVLLLSAFVRPKDHLVPRVAGGFVIFSGLAFGYFPWLELVTTYFYFSGLTLLVACWYIALTLLMMAYLKTCFHISLPDFFYACVVSYATQHVVYVVVHELLALWLWTDLANHLVLYAVVSAAACVVWYGLLYRVYFRRLSFADGWLLGSSTKSALLMTVLLVMLMGCTFGFQHLFRSYEPNRIYAVWMSVVLCVMVICFMYVIFLSTLANRERAATEQMLVEGAHHWEYSRDLIENVNRTVHDLKHTLRALEQLPEGEREEFVTNTESYVKSYEATVYSENEVLNTVLSEKALLCENRGISFSCTVDHADFDFMSAVDLYVLLGNVIDNAVEGVEKLEDRAKRVISLHVKDRMGLVLISCDNPYEGKIVMRGDLPATSKADELRHGYGLKSARLIVEKYGGSLSVGTQDNVFTVQMAIPTA